MASIASVFNRNFTLQFTESLAKLPKLNHLIGIGWMGGEIDSQMGRIDAFERPMQHRWTDTIQP